MEEDIGTNRALINVKSSAPSPENIVTKVWEVPSPVNETDWQFTDQLITSAIPHTPAESFIGTCGVCAQCSEWRRCGKFNGDMYCGEDCRNQMEARLGDEQTN